MCFYIVLFCVTIRFVSICLDGCLCLFCLLLDLVVNYCFAVCLVLTYVGYFDFDVLVFWFVLRVVLLLLVCLGWVDLLGLRLAGWWCCLCLITGDLCGVICLDLICLVFVSFVDFYFSDCCLIVGFGLVVLFCWFWVLYLGCLVICCFVCDMIVCMLLLDCVLSVFAVAWSGFANGFVGVLFLFIAWIVFLLLCFACWFGFWRWVGLRVWLIVYLFVFCFVCVDY